MPGNHHIRRARSPARLGLSDDTIAFAPKTLRSVYTDHNTTDVANLIADLTTPALFVLTWEHNEQPDTQAQQLSDHAIQHGHTVRWVQTHHDFVLDKPQLPAQIVTDFLTTITSTS